MISFLRKNVETFRLFHYTSISEFLLNSGVNFSDVYVPCRYIYLLIQIDGYTLVQLNYFVSDERRKYQYFDTERIRLVKIRNLNKICIEASQTNDNFLNFTMLIT